MIIITIILLFVLALWLVTPRRLSQIEIENTFRSRADFSIDWMKKYPSKEKEIEKFLIIFCTNFWLPPSLWKNFKPEDKINIVYDYLYPKITKWWQFEGGDNLEHNFLTHDLEEQTGIEFPPDECEKLTTLSECFEYFYIKIR